MLVPVSVLLGLFVNVKRLGRNKAIYRLGKSSFCLFYVSDSCLCMNYHMNLVLDVVGYQVVGTTDISKYLLLVTGFKESIFLSFNQDR